MRKSARFKPGPVRAPEDDLEVLGPLAIAVDQPLAVQRKGDTPTYLQKGLRTAGLPSSGC
jgi:hypothetical protein